MAIQKEREDVRWMMEDVKNKTGATDWLLLLFLLSTN